MDILYAVFIQGRPDITRNLNQLDYAFKSKVKYKTTIKTKTKTTNAQWV